MTAPSIVTLGRPGEEKAIFDFLLLLASENGLFKVDSGRSIDMIMRATHQDKATVGLIKDYKGNIEAASMLCLDTFWYSSDWYLTELLNFVKPEHRRSMHAKALLKFQQDFADRMTAALGQKIGLLTGVTTRSRLEPKIRMFQRAYPQIGALFAYNFELPDDQYNQKKLEFPKKTNDDRNAPRHKETVMTGGVR